MDPENITIQPISPEILICGVCIKQFLSIYKEMVNFIDPVMNADHINQENKGQNLEIIISNT